MPRIRRKSSVRNNAQVSFASSVSDLDPEGSIATELKLVKRIQRQHDKKSKVPSESATLASVHEVWKKAKEEDSNNNSAYSYPNSIADLLDFAKDENVKKKKSSSFVNDKGKGKPKGMSRSSSLVGTRTQGAKLENFSEQMEQMFEKFGVPLDPLPLKKSSRRGKRRKSNDALTLPSDSGAFSNLKKGKEKPFSNVSSKVDTRWKQMDVFRHALKLSSQNLLSQQSVKAESTSTTKSKSKISERPSILKKGKSGILKTSENEFPVKQKSSKVEKLVTNYPASEAVKNEKKKLPLTIAPKYNAKKILELTRETGRSVSDATARNSRKDEDNLVSTPVRNLAKQENTVADYEKKRLKKKRFNISDFLRGSLFDLKQFENEKSRISGEKGDPNNNDTKSMTLSRISTHMLSAPVSRTDSLQTQPSAFLTTKISIRRRLNNFPTFREDDDGVPKLPKVTFVETQELSRLPMHMNGQKPFKRFPIPWKYPNNQIMTSKEKKAFPLTKKARQKRNTYAFAYANRALSDDDGASSPINLLHRSSIAELDPAEDANSLALKRRRSSTQAVKVDSVVLSQRTSSSQIVNSILLNKKSSESICSSGGRRPRSGSKHRIRFSEENFTRGPKDFNGNTYRSKSQASVCRSDGSSSTSVSNTSSRSSLKGSRQNSPVKSRSSVTTNKKRPAPVVKEFRKLQRALNGDDSDIEEVDLISSRSFHDVTEAISSVNDTLIQGIVDIYKTVANLFTFSLFRQEENVEPPPLTSSTSTTSTNDANTTEF